MARKTGQIIGRAPRTWVVRVYVGRDAETKKRKYLNKTIHGGLRDAQAHLNRMLSERDLGRNLDSSKQTLNQYLDRWLEVRVVRVYTQACHGCGSSVSRRRQAASANTSLRRGTASTGIAAYRSFTASVIVTPANPVSQFRPVRSSSGALRRTRRQFDGGR